MSGFRFPELRHHFASRLLRVGVDLNTVRDILGQDDIKMTLAMPTRGRWRRLWRSWAESALAAIYKGWWRHG